jgi:hypothetical protein
MLLYKEYEETIKNPFYMRMIVQLEMDIYSELLQKRYTSLQGTVGEIAQKYFYGAPTQVVYAFLYNLQSILSTDIESIKDTDVLNVALDINKIYDHLEKNGYRYLLEINGWHLRNSYEISGKTEDIFELLYESKSLAPYLSESTIITKFSELEALIEKYENGVLLSPIISEDGGIFMKKNGEGYIVLSKDTKLFMDYDELCDFYIKEVKKKRYSVKEYVGSFTEEGRAIHIRVIGDLKEDNTFESKVLFTLSKEIDSHFTNMDMSMPLTEEEFFTSFGENQPLKLFLEELKSEVPYALSELEKRNSGNQVALYELILTIDIKNLKASLLEVIN